ncbi:hypothetical protein, partial [Candidatus Avelusimicrobium fimicolum]|uniref:hypothetical protein n=1 Tax=Candidatus Avelusimicrobium fimicolum TaxID=3416216 RepID=UPI003D0E3684
SHRLGGIFILYGEAHQLLGARRDLKAGAMFEFARKKYRIAQGENREARPEGFFRQEKDRREVSFPGKRFRSHRLGGIFILYGEAHQLLSFICP